jgi:S-adenosylmethionine:diacylglycerol 3-amino-3-carboxypropyl transferase
LFAKPLLARFDERHGSSDGGAIGILRQVFERLRAAFPRAVQMSACAAILALVGPATTAQ